VGVGQSGNGGSGSGDDPMFDSEIVVSFGRNSANATNIWLRLPGNVPSNLSPFRFLFDVELVGISSTTEDVETWDVEIYTGTSVRSGGVPNDADKITEMLNVSANSNACILSPSIEISAGTELGVFCRGTNISRPTVHLWFQR